MLGRSNGPAAVLLYWRSAREAVPAGIGNGFLLPPCFRSWLLALLLPFIHCIIRDPSTPIVSNCLQDCCGELFSLLLQLLLSSASAADPFHLWAWLGSDKVNSELIPLFSGVWGDWTSVGPSLIFWRGVWLDCECILSIFPLLID